MKYKIPKPEFMIRAFEQIGEAIIITSKELDYPGPKIIYVNPAFTKMTGYKPEEVIGKTPRILQGPKTDKLRLKRMRKELDKGRSFTDEIINYKKDGSEYILDWNIFPIKNDKGKIINWISIQRDISQRKRLEQKLRSLERKQLKLTKKEKKILLHLIAYPEKNDIQISKLSKIKRSTVTSIKNRLLRAEWLTPTYAPNLPLLGCELVRITYGRFPETEISKKFKVVHPQLKQEDVVFATSSGSDFVSISFLKDIADIIEPLGTNVFDEKSKLQKSFYFPVSSSERFDFFNFEKTVSSLLDMKIDKIQGPHSEPEKLSARDKKLILSLVNNPGLGNLDLAKKINVSPQTFTKSLKRLQDQGFIKKLNIPNLSKFSGPLVFLHLQLDQKKCDSVLCMKSVSDYVKPFFEIEWKKHLMILGIFKNYQEKEFEFQEYLNNLYAQDALKDIPKVIIFPQQKIIYQKLDFLPTTKKIL